MKPTVGNIERAVLAATKAWEGMCPSKSISGLTLEQFRQSVQPSVDARTQLAMLEVEWKKGMTAREAADRASMITLARIVHGIKGDPELGEDSAFYEALGYVRKSQRGSGLTRRREKEAATETTG